MSQKPPSPSLDTQTLIEWDKQHVWHPYSAVNSLAPIYPVSHAEGVRITLHDGRELIDGMSSWWSVLHGYNHPELNQAVRDQLDHMAHIMFGGLTHEPAITLCKHLAKIAPGALEKVFLCDSGSVAIEVAMKMALQYWHSQGKPEKNRLLSLSGGYHGDTFAAMSVCDPVTGMHHLFQQNLTQQFFCEKPTCGFNEPLQAIHLKSVTTQIETHHKHIAAVVLEPIVQGTGGMNFYSPDYLKAVRQLCNEFNVLLIADEIATGLGRTGKLFACEHAGIAPDILCLGKTLTAGYITLAATLCTPTIAQGIAEGEAAVLMHGPTYMGNPLACAVANKSLDLLLHHTWEGLNWQGNIKRLEQGLNTGLAPCRALPHVKDVRVLGAIGVVELTHPVALDDVQDLFVQAGIWVRPFGKLVYIMPPYVMNDNDLDFLTHQLTQVVKRIGQR
ncbi:adenosylmethionine--8-amino-7-oxononanoate transaminase [Marinibactrum halimedae]|uniref:Adenosylmethionine-8-amino-7-oxononanoate aminotransferase n=1 Tax=Marinibactrum halimedae TaxID=1444977 RepID=A0AA37T7U4_9GAMM|nr:adenosylmethionine--8-amino-7-oxononanoate transaminase [Marinibactrum halimedae]MCD9460875.1 adenosylmethionine--8-amino-7-oxononanoate transaminase [Marinibactrum halimedae]GLS27346.1 adenosylmethionine-8-amino-7-oxononanoate aminotransferase [Marinibactrum halimedae]